MAANPTRAVRLISLDGYVGPAELGAEGIEAYTTVQKTTEIVRLVSTGSARLTYSRNAATEAAGRIFAAQNFR